MAGSTTPPEFWDQYDVLSWPLPGHVEAWEKEDDALSAGSGRDTSSASLASLCQQACRVLHAACQGIEEAEPNEHQAATDDTKEDFLLRENGSEPEIDGISRQNTSTPSLCEVAHKQSELMGAMLEHVSRTLEGWVKSDNSRSGDEYWDELLC